MTVHNVMVRAEKPDGISIEEISNAVESYVDRHEETLQPERTDVSLTGGEDPMLPGPEHVIGSFRFAATEGKRALLDEAESLLQNHVSWYVVRHHWCAHDEAESGRATCSWDETTAYGPVPGEVAP